jgi:predicted porin
MGKNEMNKYLYGTTSLVGLGMLAGAGSVQAADPVSLSLGGFFHQWQGIVDSEFCFGQPTGTSNDCNSGEIVQVGEIFFNVSGEMDNGITVGGRMELELQQDNDVIDGAWIELGGDFGLFALGQMDSARHNLAFGTAANNEGILINSGWETAFAGTSQSAFGLLRPSHSTALDFSDKAPKLAYFTPRFNGLQFNATWTPNTQHSDNSAAGQPGGSPRFGGGAGSLQFGQSDKNSTYTNALDFGVDYSGEMNGVGVYLQAGYGTVDTPDLLDSNAANTDDDDPNIYQAGIALTFGGARAAFGWARETHGIATQSATVASHQRMDGHSYTFGVGYGTGPWAFSAGFLHGEDEGQVNDPGNDENEFIQVSASYAIGPGLSVNAQYLNIDREQDGTGEDETTDAVFLGVKVGF